MRTSPRTEIPGRPSSCGGRTGNCASGDVALRCLITEGSIDSASLAELPECSGLRLTRANRSDSPCRGSTSVLRSGQRGLGFLSLVSARGDAAAAVPPAAGPRSLAAHVAERLGQVPVELLIGRLRKW